MATIGSAKATLVNKIDSLTSSATAKDTIFLAKALKENSSLNNFVWQGPWTNSTAYYVDDVVTNSGNTYMCILAYTSAASPGAFAVGSNWSIMAEKGSTVGTGTAGQVLKTNSAGTGIEWGADEGGKILQVVNYYTSTQGSVTLASGTYTAPNPTINKTITPVGTSSNFLVSVRWAGEVNSAHDIVGALVRDGTRVNAISGNYHGLTAINISYPGTNDSSTPESMSFNTLDTTGSTAGTAIAYSLEFGTDNNTHTMWTNRCFGAPTQGNETFTSEIIITEIGA